jgi:ribosome recycling factor
MVADLRISIRAGVRNACGVNGNEQDGRRGGCVPEGAKKGLNVCKRYFSIFASSFRVKIDYYGTPTPISQAATISVVDARTLSIQPYEKKHIGPIEKAIMDANLGVNPQNDGIVIRVVLPMLTEERRKQLVKQAKEIAEEARVAVRNLRREHNEQIKKLSKSGVSEDEIKTAENDIQKVTDRYIAEIDKLFAAKEADIMKL